IFNTRQTQSPPKDSVTWNPAFMFNGQTLDENQARGLYAGILTGATQRAEKTWLRQWYEPLYLDLDADANGTLTIEPTTALTTPTVLNDVAFAAVLEEFSYILVEGPTTANPLPVAGAAGQTSFVFPIGMRQADVNDPFGYGLTSFDANFDGTPDIVKIDSE